MSINFNTEFPSFTSREDGEEEIQVIPIVQKKRYEVFVTPYMNIEGEDWGAVNVYKPSIHDVLGNETGPKTNDLSLLHHADVLLFDNKKVEVCYTLMATIDTDEDNVTVTKCVKAPNGENFTLRSFIETIFEHVSNDYKYHLPKSFEDDSQGDYPNELDHFMVDLKTNIVNVYMYY